MATRPAKVELTSGVEGWDAAVADNDSIILDGPFPIFRVLNLSTLTNSYPPDEYEHCLGMTQDDGSIYCSDGTTWIESIPGPGLTKGSVSFFFRSSLGTTGTLHTGGYYFFSSSHDDFNPSVNFGTANGSYAGHLLVVLGAATVDELTITVSGTSIQDDGTRTTTDTEDIVIPDATSADAYFETAKKWVGQVSIEATGGTAKDCNYGFCKYWDNQNRDFTVTGFEATWLAGASDASVDIKVLYHSATGWTYNAGAEPTPPTEITGLQGTHVTEYQTVVGHQGAFKRTGLSQAVLGGDSEGIMIQIDTTSASTFEYANLTVDFTQ